MNRGLAAVLTLAILAPAAGVSGTRGVGAARDWPAYGGGPEGLRYSRLRQIHRGNVKDLRVAWTFDTGDAFEGSEMQCHPLVVGGVLYAITPRNDVIALDGGTGRLRWRFSPLKGEKPRRVRNRGLAYWTDGRAARVFVGVRHQLFALDAGTGTPDPGFGDGGAIDLRRNLREGELLNVALSSPGIVYKDLLIVGSLTSEALPTPPGDIRAYDVRTGALRWAFHTIPRPGEFGHDTWPPEAWTYAGSANNWTGMALDPERGLVFVPTGSAAYDFYGANRAGDNLFANSLLALEAATGERVWHFQFVRHDIWDRDLPAPPVLVTVEREGRRVDAVAQTTKSGHVFVFDRETGRPLFPVEYRKYPPSDIEGETTAETQPLPLAPAPFSRQRLTADMLTTRTPEAHRAVLERFRALRSDGQFVPGSREGTVIFPGFDGGAEWGGAAFDPETSLLYVNANEMAWILTLKEAPRAAETTARDLYATECAACHGADRRGTPPEFPSLEGIGGRRTVDEIRAVLREGKGRMPGYSRLGPERIDALVDFLAMVHEPAVTLPVAPARPSPADMRYMSDGYHRFLDPEGYPAVSPPWGTLNAIHLGTGRYAWTIPLGEYPELAARGMKATGTENYGGPLVTAGGLVFIAATSFDRKMRAFDKATGALLWEVTLPAAGNATPSTYEVNGRQYVVIAAGGGKSKHPSGGSYVAFALPARR